jgi:hypothetical protein
MIIVYEQLILNVLDWDRSNGIQVVNLRSKRSTTNGFFYVHHVQKNCNLYVDQNSQLSYIII